MLKQVFISYSSGDKQVADRMCSLLEERSIPCWMAPRDIPAAADFPETIISAIENTPFLLLILTDESNRSRHVHSEAGVAFSCGRAMVLLRMIEAEPCKTLRYFFHNAQWLNGQQDDLARLGDQIADVVRNRPETVQAEVGRSPEWRALAAGEIRATSPDRGGHSAGTPEDIPDVAAAVNRAVAGTGLDTWASPNSSYGTPRDSNSEIVWREHLENLNGQEIPVLCYELGQAHHNWETRWKLLKLLGRSLCAPAGQWLIPVGAPAALSVIGVSELRGPALDLIRAIPASPDQKWGWLAGALRMRPTRADDLIELLVQLTPPERREETGAAILNVLRTGSGNNAPLRALLQLDYRAAIPVVRQFLALDQDAPGCAAALAKWRDRESSPLIKKAIEDRRAMPNREGEVRDLVCALYVLDGPECAPYVADLLQACGRRVQSIIIDSRSPVLDEQPVMTVIKALATNSSSSEVRKRAEDFLAS